MYCYYFVMKGYVYTLRSFQTDLIYIGSTEETLSRRMATHRSNYKAWLAEKHNYVTSFEILKFDGCYIEMLEIVEYTDKASLHAREGFHQRAMDCVNKNIAGRTGAEYYADNIEKIKKYNVAYNAAHSEQIKESNAAYYATHAEDLNRKHREYREAHKEQIKAHAAERVTCACGAEHAHGVKARHLKTAKHAARMAQLAAV